ncbi:MAG: Methyltransferase type 11, partial [Bryobacterales bacterium]|nr:Methyltransferase type 11 [Bryobacterales bacterium]
SASPIAPGSCGAVTMFHVLEHVPDPQHYLQEARTLLRPNGRLIVQVPNAACWQFVLLGRAWNGVDAPRHLHLFRDADLEKLLERSGFEIVRRKYFSLRDNPAGLATSVAPSLDPMARRIRQVPESGWVRFLKNLAYFALVVAAIPFTLLESAFRAGSTVMIEARKRAA